MAEIKSGTWTDDDGAQLWVQKGFRNGKVLFDTDPDANNVDSVVELTPRQVQELRVFLSDV